MGRTTSSRRSAIFEPFKTVWVVDVEYCQHPTGLPDIVCLAAREILSGRGFSLWRDQLRPWPPYDIGEDSLFVCYSGMEAELACQLVFNWPLPANVVDLIVEYRMAVNGIELGGEKYGLLEAATRLGIPLHVSKEEKDRIRSRIIAGWPFSDTEQAEILAYCMADVDEEAVVLRELGPEAMSPWAVWRGRFVKSVSRMWYRGVPIDPKYVRLMNDPVVRSELRGEIIDDLQQVFPFFDGLVLKNALVTEWLENNSIPVPKTPTGRTRVSHEKLEKIARDHPILEPFIEGQRVLAQLQDSSMPIGSDNRLWAYVRDERPFAGSRKPAALFFYSPDRKGEHPQVHLKEFRGVIHADGYAGFNELFAGGRIVEAGCWAHVRRKFFDVHAATGSPLAKEALDRIGQLYAVEKIINGLPPERRRQRRQLQSKPIAEALAAWAESTVRLLSRKSELAQAFRYMRARWTALVRCFDDGRLALDNNPAERALRCVAIGRKNYLFAGSDAGGRRAAALYSLIESAKLNGLNPQHYLADVLARIADHPARRIAELLPWNWQPLEATRAAA